MNIAVNPDNLFLSVTQVADRYGVSTDSIWRWRRNDDFPAPVRVGPNCTRWRMSDLIEHEGKLRTCFMTDAMFLISA
jgi:prophage regulatory protein